MTSFLAWVDHDPSERERMNRILALFQEKESRDELGVGAIRDAISDLLFPGTSTIQTRLRYMLFIPWLYTELETNRVSSKDVAKVARKAEVDLVLPLAAADPEASGILGIRARGDLKRLPSSVYWAGLRAWGVLRFDGSPDDYHRAFDYICTPSARDSRGDDGTHGRGPLTWDRSLPPRPNDFPKATTFKLRREDAEYLRDCICHNQSTSLLAFLAKDETHHEAESPWAHPRKGSFSALHRELLDHAQRLSAVIGGAAHLYNLELAKLRNNADLESHHESALREWVDEVKTLDLANWSLPRLWDLLAPTSHQITGRAQAFVSGWLAITRTFDMDSILSPAARDLVRNREMALKGTHSRYTNKRALDQWSGHAGTGRANYRWNTVQRFTLDLHEGLRG